MCELLNKSVIQRGNTKPNYFLCFVLSEAVWNVNFLLNCTYVFNTVRITHCIDSVATECFSFYLNRIYLFVLFTSYRI